MARRASARVTLVLIGAAALQGCGPDIDTTQRAQDTYLSMDDCAADWGRPEYCERQQVTTAAGTSTYFRGPFYHPSYRDSAQIEARDAARQAGVQVASSTPTNRSIGRTVGSSAGGTTSRGGFGSSARTFSGGG
ncbi:MAG TPA: hypothetical protein VLW55_27225 [Burkholderiaceae bacterium]|nr:hypothetical protein [Burkholderiaceae bacterium]